MATETTVARVEQLGSLIVTVRGLRVMLDFDLAKIYGVTTRQLNQAIKRNLRRFPGDFAFQLTRQEFVALISQSVISKAGRGGRQKVPWAFTEYGAIMLASVLNSRPAIDASVRVVRAFVYLREQLSANKQLARKLAELEGRVETHDGAIHELFEAIRQLVEPVTPAADTPGEIGFHVKEAAMPYRIRVRRRR